MVTAVISDLHLGTRTKGDLLARPDVRATLLGELDVGGPGRAARRFDRAPRRAAPRCARSEPPPSSRTWATRCRGAGSCSCPETTTISSPRAGSSGADLARWGWRSCPHLHGAIRYRPWPTAWAARSWCSHIPAFGCDPTCTRRTATTSTATTTCVRSSAWRGRRSRGSRASHGTATTPPRTTKPC